MRSLPILALFLATAHGQYGYSSCGSGYDPCEDQCIPAGFSCCVGGGGCDPGSYCDGDGCCPDGEQCSGGGGTLRILPTNGVFGSNYDVPTITPYTYTPYTYNHDVSSHDYLWSLSRYSASLAGGDEPTRVGATATPVDEARRPSNAGPTRVMATAVQHAVLGAGIMAVLAI